jgi:hypothetical protein
VTGHSFIAGKLAAAIAELTAPHMKLLFDAYQEPCEDA